jgi:hypothetical protein
MRIIQGYTSSDSSNASEESEEEGGLDEPLGQVYMFMLKHNPSTSTCSIFF